MRFDIITIFPEAFKSYLNTSILKRAQKRGLISVGIHGLRKWGKGKHKQLDDKPYGGGAGMVLMAEPILKAVEKLGSKEIKKWRKTKIVILSAKGKQFNQKMAHDWAKRCDRLILVSGRYEGIDERVRTAFKAEEISIGPYVLTGGELPAMTVLDAVSRHIPGVLGKAESLEEKRYGVGVPIYTRPEIFKWKGKFYRASKVLLSGNHAKIDDWRKRHQKGYTSFK